MSTTLPSLDAIQARADAATEGPWVAWEVDAGFVTRPDKTPDEDEFWIAEGYEEPDAAFIADARTDVPVLVAALRAVLVALGPHWDEQVRREAQFGRTGSSCVCYGCNAVRALAAHLDLTDPEGDPT